MPLCTIEGCGRKHAAHGLCLMHYKRVQRHGSPEYRWGGKVVGRPCLHCERQAIAKGMCFRHYQMDRKHGDPLYADKRKTEGLPNGTHLRRNYEMVCPVAEFPIAVPATSASVEKSDRSHANALKALGLRDGSKRSRREWKHRKVVNAKIGEIVHHIDGDYRNNERSNLHIFYSAKDHADAHRSLEKLAFSLLMVGLVEFDHLSAALQSIGQLEQPMNYPKRDSDFHQDTDPLVSLATES